MKYKLDMPYPSIDELDINLQYGQILLSNLGSIHSKTNTVSLYFYNHIITESSWPELSIAMKEIGIVEMQHLDFFAKMCFRLGVDPRLWDCQNDFLEYWSPGYNVYPRQIKSMLENILIQEHDAIEIYQNQITCIEDPVIQDMLKRIIKDEELHIQIFEYFLQAYNKRHHASQYDYPY